MWYKWGGGREGGSCRRGDRTIDGCGEKDRSAPGEHGTVVDPGVVLEDMQFS